MALPDVRWSLRGLLLAVVLAAARAAPGGDYRLPGNFIPTNYQLKMVPYLEEGNMRYTGTVKITVTATADGDGLPSLTLHVHEDLQPNVAVDSFVDIATNLSVKSSRDPEYDKDKQFLTIFLNTKIKEGTQYLLSLSFSNTLQRDNYGFYISSYKFNGKTEYMATTQFEATSARKAFPCFDEPLYRATFDISVAKLDDQIALSNMPPVGEPSDYDPTIGNRRWVDFQTTPEMPTYLVAFVVSKLKRVSTDSEMINIYVREGAEDEVTEARRVAPLLLKALERLTGVKYPLPKLDLVAIPDFPAGAMENWGLITFKEDMLLVTEDSTADRLAESLRVIAHEFAHLWFGDYVTLKWWDTIWQQEGMAAFMESYILDVATSNAYEAMSRLGTSRVQSALEVDSLENASPLTKDVQTPAEIEDHFDTISYSKGSNVHYMLLNILGLSLYKDGLQNYLNQYKYSSTTPDDFAEALQTAADKNPYPLHDIVVIKDLIDSWTLKSGYPVLTVLREYEHKNASISQSRFLAHEPSDSSLLQSKWIIPFRVNINDQSEDVFDDALLETDTDHTLWLSELGEDGYLYINRGQHGFYRVNYDVRNWLNLATGASQLDAATRATLIDDLFALNRAGLVDTWIVLWHLQKTLGDTSGSGEKDMAPWITAAKVLRGYSAVARGDPELSTHLQSYLSAMLAPVFKTIEWDRADDTEDDSYERSVVRGVITQLACDFGLAACRRRALETFSVFQDEGIDDPNVLAATLCEGVKTDSSLAEEFVKAAIQKEDVTLRASYLRAAGCTKDSNVVSRLLEYMTTKDSGLSSSELLYLLKSIMDHSADGCETVLQFVEKNYDDIVDDSAESILMEIAKRIYNQDQLDTIKAIATDKGKNVRVIALVAEATLKWVTDNSRELKQWVSAQVGVIPPRPPMLVPKNTDPNPPVPPTAEPRPTEPPKVTSEWLLPDDLQPQSYVLDIDTEFGDDPDTNPEDFKFSGTVAITLKVITSTTQIVMHKHKSLEVDSSSITVVDSDNNPVVLQGDPEYIEEKEFFKINLEQALTEGSTYVVSLSFSGPLKKDLAGLYLSSYKVLDETKFLAVTQFEQTSARKAFPCWDEPKYRATFKISITHDDTFTALSNMATTSSRKKIGASRAQTLFKTTPLMPTYLVALLISELKEVEVQDDSPKISIWVREGAEDEVELAKDLAPKVLRKLEDLTGIPYPLDKLDLAAIPDFAPGAMENWGLITFKDTVLRTPKGALAHRRFNCARDITHEFSHLWFGDLVTNNWWSSLWQQEGMAAFMEAWVLDQATNYEYDAVSRQSVDRIDQGLYDDALETSGPITNHTVGSPQEIEEHSGEMTYNKGAGFLRMIRAILGESTMWKGLRKYLRAHAYSTAGPDDLAAAFQEAADEAKIDLPVSIQDIMDSWTLKKGYPVLQVDRNLHDSYLTIKQSRFLSYEPTDPKATEEHWIVPFNCKGQYSQSMGGLPFDQFLLTDEEQLGLTFSSEDGVTYVICNTEQEGFYRVNYDITTWRFIGQALKARMIQSGTQRGALLDDALTLLRARQLDPWIVMYILENGVPGENSLPAWGALSKGLNYLRSALSGDDQATEDFNRFVADLTADAFGAVDWYNYWGWEESVQKNEVRQIVSRLACDAGESLCVTYATADNYADYSDTPVAIHQETYGARLCLAYAAATDPEVLLQALKNNEDYDQRVSIAYALGCATNKDVRTGLLLNLTDPANNVFKSNEITPFFESLVTHGGVDEAIISVGAGLMFDFLSMSVGESKALELLQLVSERVNTDEQYQVIASYADLNPSIQTTVAERSAANALKFVQNELAQVKDYLAVYANRTLSSPPTLEDTEYRLPGNVVPENYNLTITPYLEQGKFHYAGSVVIQAKTKANVTDVVLHSHKNLDVVLNSVTNLGTGKTLGIQKTAFNQLSEMYTITLDETIEADTEISIYMEFSGPLLKDKLGFYLSDYPDGVTWKYMATTQFEQTYARKAFPCFDEPKYRATFDIKIARLPSQIALSNAPLKSTSEPDPDVDNRVWDTFYTTPPMPTYLVAFIVSELQKIPTTNPMINLYVRPEIVPPATFAAEITPKILAELENFTGVPYAMEKLDLVGIPDFYFGAMENWGLCTFRENRLLYSEGNSTKEYKIFVAEIIAHELSHLWFGDYVTLDWWSSGWLKEGMAEFLQYFILEKVLADDAEKWYPLSRLGVDDVFDGMSSDALEFTGPLTDDDVETQEEIAEHMGLYTYEKGAGLHYMLMGALGEETFKKGLNYYLKKNAYGAATPDDYADALQEAADEDYALPEDIFVIDLIHSWAAKSGLPVVTLIRNYNDNTVTVSQHKYLAVSPMSESSRDGQWIVPVSIYFNYGVEPKKATTFLRDDSKSVTVSLGGSRLGGTIYGNWQGQGYFHTNYDLLNWIRLGSVFAAHDIRDPMFRASTIHDAFALAKGGFVDPWMPLYLLEKALPSEYNAAPYIAAYNGLRAYAALVKKDPEAERLFQTYLRDFLLETAYDNVGWNSSVGDTDGRVAREMVTKLACSARLSDCRTTALQAYNDYLDDSSSVDPNVLATSLCEGLSYGTTREYTKFYEVLVAETERSHRMSIVYALGCVRNSTILNGLLDLGGTMQGFEPQEVLPLFRSILDNGKDGIDVALKYVVKNFDLMAASLGQSSAEEVVMAVARRLSSEAQYQTISLLQKFSDSDSVRDAVDVAAANVLWTSTALPTLKDWLAAKTGVMPPSPPVTFAVPIVQTTPAPAVPTPGIGPTEPPASSAPTDEWRLPSSLEPLNYKLEMVPILEVNNFEFEGRVDITILAKESTAEILMHAKDLVIPLDTVNVYDQDTHKTYEVEDLDFVEDKGFLKLTLGQNLTVGDKYVVHLEFNATLRTDNFGFYVSSYVLNDETKYMATTHFEATSARKAFPCFDEPRFRATFDISVARLPGQTALSNMPKISTSDPDMAIGGRVWDDFDTTPSMPTYLVAFMVHELSQVPTSKSNINIWVRPDAVKDTTTAVEIAPLAIQAMENYTNFKLPVPKVDLVAIPTFPIGAMENWGLATFREDYIINPAKAKSEHAFTCSSVIQHELSHFWFGDLVTIDWWSAAWLKEGMASFLELYMLDRADGSRYSAFKRILYEQVEPAMLVDARESADVLTNYTVGSPDAIADHMSDITYYKGGSFLRMMMHFVGEDAYRKGLSDYITSNAYYWGSPKKLAAALQSAADDMSKTMRVSVQDMFDSWTLKQGFPVVTFIRDRKMGIATLTQKRFLTHDPTPDYNSNATWNVPYNLWIEGESIPTSYSDVLLESQAQKTILVDGADSKLVLLNADKTGFYRVNYDLLTWINLNNRLQQQSISSAEQRAALIADSMALALARQLEFWVPLSILESDLPYETDLLPWIAARDAIFRLRAILFYREYYSISLFDKWVSNLVRPVYEKLDWEPRWPAAEEYNDKLLRDVVSQIACLTGSALCQRSASFDYEAWLFQTADTNPDTLAATLCYGFSDSDGKKFPEAWERFLAEEDPTVRSAMLYGFGCLDDDSAARVLEAAANHAGIASHEAKRFYNSFIVNSPLGVTDVINYIDQNYYQIKENTGVEAIAAVLQLVAERISTRSQRNTIAYLTEIDPCIEMTVVKQTAYFQYKWIEADLANVMDYLEAAAGEAPTPPTPAPGTGTTAPPILPTDPTPSGYYRLLTNAVPQDYKVKVVPYLSGDKQGTFDGEVNITFTTTEVVRYLVFHAAAGLKFSKDDVTILDNKQKPVPMDYVYPFDVYEWVQISFVSNPLTAERTYTIQVSYTGEFSDDMKGFYLTSQDGNEGPMTVAMTKLAPTYARRVFPCFDEPALKATFTLTVGALPSETVVSNTAVASTSEPDASIGNRVLVTFKTTPKISTHSLTIVVSSGLKSLSSADKNITLYGTDKLVARGQDTIKAAQSIIKTMETITGTPSGLDALSLVGVKDVIVEGSDNWGVDILRENALVKLDTTASAGEADIYWLTSTAHRIAQHWFGDLVSMAWWDNVWLTDGFGTYFQYKAASLTDANGSLMLYPATFAARVTSPALHADSFESAPALTNQNVIGSQAGIEKSISDISSLKGGAIVNSLPHILGATAFESGLKNLLVTNYLGSVEPSALYSALQSGVDEDSSLPDGANVSTVLSSWVSQEGYPVVNVIRDYDKDTATLSQERFLIHSPSGSANMEGAWYIPVSYSARNQYAKEYSTTPIKAWLEPGSTTDLPLPSKSAAQWLLVNLDRKGFYRVNYDLVNWQLLALYISEPANHIYIQIPTRVMLLDDALSLARSGRLDYATALQYVDYLRNEYVTHEIFATAREAFGTHLETFLLGTKLEDVYKAWVGGLLASAIKYFDYTPKSDDNSRFLVARSVVMEWACDLDIDECVTPALKDYPSWVQAINSTPHDTVGSTVCAGVRNLTSDDYEGYEMAITNLGLEMNDVYRKAIIRGLGCVRETSLAKSLLGLTTEKLALRAGEALEAFKSVTRFGPSTVDAALDFLNDTVLKVSKGSGLAVTKSIISLVASRVTTEAQNEKLNAVVKTLLDGSADRQISVAQLLTADNLQWQTTYQDEVGDMLYALSGVPNPDLPAPPTTTAAPTTTTLVIPTGVSPTDPTTRAPDTSTSSWFTLPPTVPTSPVTLPPLPTTSTSTPQPQPSSSTATPSPDTTTKKSGAGGVVANALLVAVSLLWLREQASA